MWKIVETESIIKQRYLILLHHVLCIKFLLEVYNFFLLPLSKPQEILGIVKVTEKGPWFDLKNNTFILFFIKMNKCKQDYKSDDTKKII